MDIHVYWNIFTMHGPMNVKFPNNTSKWQIEFNSAFKGLKRLVFNKLAHYMLLFTKVHAETSPPHRPAIANVIRHGCRIYLFIGLTTTTVIVVLTHFLLHRVYVEAMTFISTYTSELMSLFPLARSLYV
jgi:hypothetical protein